MSDVVVRFPWNMDPVAVATAATALTAQGFNDVRVSSPFASDGWTVWATNTANGAGSTSNPPAAKSDFAVPPVPEATG